MPAIPVVLKNTIRPSNFNIRRGLMGSRLHKSEKETVACNIIIISRENGDGWFEFSFEEYIRRCNSKVSDEMLEEILNRQYSEMEQEILDQFVREDRILDFDGERYSVNETFFRKLAQFIK